MAFHSINHMSSVTHTHTEWLTYRLETCDHSLTSPIHIHAHTHDTVLAFSVHRESHVAVVTGHCPSAVVPVYSHMMHWCRLSDSSNSDMQSVFESDDSDGSDETDASLDSGGAAVDAAVEFLPRQATGADFD